MAWPKPRSRRSRGSAETDTAHSHAVTPDRDPDRRPSWPSAERWPSAHATIAPVPTADVPEADPADDRPFWETWGRADLDEAEDGVPEDDGVTDVDPRPQPSWAPVAGPASKAREAREAREVRGEPGIGQRLGGVAHLSANPRARAWQRRVIVAVIAGVLFGFLLGNWRWGLTFAVLAAIADAVIRSRTVFKGPAGVKLTKAQKRTLRQLSKLERKGYRAMHILPIPDSEEQIDHLVIGPAGVFAIDSEDWDKRMPVRTSNHRNLWHGPRSMVDRLEHARWESDQASALLSAVTGSPVPVRPAMAVYGPKIPWDVAEIRDVDTFSGPRLRIYLRRRARRRDNSPLSKSEVERIDKAAHVAFHRDAAAS
jgi:Nuclease-related domain